MAKDLGKEYKLHGTAIWAHTSSPEVYDGNPIGFSIMVALESDEKTEAFKNELENLFNDAEGELDKKANRKIPINLSVKEDKDYGECFKAKTKHEFKDRTTGEIKKRTLPVFDKFGKPLPAGTLIGNGSKVQVKVKADPYIMSGKNYGVTLRLLGVLVEDLKEYSNTKSAESMGFDVVEADGDESFNTEIDF